MSSGFLLFKIHLLHVHIINWSYTLFLPWHRQIGTNHYNVYKYNEESKVSVSPTTTRTAKLTNLCKHTLTKMMVLYWCLYLVVPILVELLLLLLLTNLCSRPFYYHEVNDKSAQSEWVNHEKSTSHQSTVVIPLLLISKQ